MIIVLLTIAAGGVVVESEVICPLPSEYSPCDCREPTLLVDQGTIVLDCNRRDLDDAAVSKILDKFLTTIGVSPLGYASFTANRLTKVPDQINKFARLLAVALDYNQIATVPTGAFNFVTTLRYLYLSYNQLTTISPGAFQGKFKVNSIQFSFFISTET